MQVAENIGWGQTVRLTTAYRDAERGVYFVIYVYRNGWLGVVSRANGRRFNVPGYICRHVDNPVKHSDA